MNKYERKDPWCKICGGRHPNPKSFPFAGDNAPVSCDVVRLPEGTYTRRALAQLRGHESHTKN